MGETEFDTDGVFDEDYLHFYGGLLTDERSDADTELIWRLLDVEPGMAVLDLACGHGRIANRLAERGCRVTGLDATPLFLDRARRDAAARGLDVEYVHGDMRKLPWYDRFDRVISWFTSYGYFDDEGNREVLRQAAGALKPGGQLLLDLNNRDWIIRNFLPDRVTAQGDDMMVDRTVLDPLTGTAQTERIIIRDGRIRRTSFVVRLFTFTELRDWLLDAGFSEVRAYGEEATPLSTGSRRMTVIARR